MNKSNDLTFVASINGTNQDAKQRPIRLLVASNAAGAYREYPMTIKQALSLAQELTKQAQFLTKGES